MMQNDSTSSNSTNGIFKLRFKNLDAIIKNLPIFKNEYKIISPIKINDNRGIYKVINITTQQKYVLKFVLASDIDENKMNIFEFYKNNVHKNFCRLYDAKKYDMFYLLVLEYIDGDNLGTFFSENINDRCTIKNIIFDIMSAIKYIHSNNIMHCDIKPDNIIIRYDPFENTYYPVIIDFDTSKYACCGMEYYTKYSFGTKKYIAPEIFNHIYKQESDIWSLGVTLYYTLSNLNILYNNNSFDITDGLKSIEHTFGSNIANVIKNMLVYNVKYRIGIDTLIQQLTLDDNVLQQVQQSQN